MRLLHISIDAWPLCTQGNNLLEGNQRRAPDGDFGDCGGGGGARGRQSVNASLKASKNWFTAFLPPCAICVLYVERMPG